MQEMAYPHAGEDGLTLNFLIRFSVAPHARNEGVTIEDVRVTLNGITVPRAAWTQHGIDEEDLVAACARHASADETAALDEAAEERAERRRAILDAFSDTVQN
jgi:sulfur carrier protein ThiS